MKLIFATRPSALARWQTQWIIQALQQAHPGLECETHVITTRGDRVLDKPLPEIGGKGLFTQELDAELLSGRVDAAVHSLKDLPVENPPGLTIGAIPLRADARDALVSEAGYDIESLPTAARVGTSSPRLAAQILAVRPDLQIESIRGNVDTRLRKLLDGQYEAVVFAAAGLQRLGLDAEIGDRMHVLPLDVMLPAPGQGALAVQCRRDDAQTLGLLAAIEHPPTRQAVTAERAFLEGLGGGCSVPVASHADVTSSVISLSGLVASPDGQKIIRVHSTNADPLELGRRLAAEAAFLGANRLLADDQ